MCKLCNNWCLFSRPHIVWQNVGMMSASCSAARLRYCMHLACSLHITVGSLSGKESESESDYISCQAHMCRVFTVDISRVPLGTAGLLSPSRKLWQADLETSRFKCIVLRRFFSPSCLSEVQFTTALAEFVVCG